MLSHFICVWLFCDSTDCSPSGSSVHGIIQARILEWVAISFSGVFPTQGSNPCLLHCRQILYPLNHLGSHNSAYMCALSCFSHFRGLCDPMDYSLPGPSFQGIIQARIPEWTAISFSRGYSILKTHEVIPDNFQTLNLTTIVLIKREKTGKKSQKAMWSQRQKLESSCYEWTNIGGTRTWKRLEKILP